MEDVDGRLQHSLIGAFWGPMVTSPHEVGYMGASRPSAPVAELSAIMAFHALVLQAGLLQLQYLGLRSDSSYALGVMELRTAS